MKITLVNQPINNRGDEAAHKSLIRFLNNCYPDVQITILFQNAGQNSIDQMRVDVAQNNYINIQTTNIGAGLMRNWGLRLGLLRLSALHPAHSAMVKHIKSADLVVCAPGGICMGLFQNWRHIYVLSLALNLHKKVAYYSRSFGPFPTQTAWNRVFKKISYKLLKDFDFVSIRDARTMRLAEEIGINYIPSIDTAFLDRPNIELPTKIKDLLGIEDYIVFVPNSLRWHAAFKNIDADYLSNFYIKLMNKIMSKYENTNIIMLPQLFNDGAKSDENYFKGLKSKIKSERIIVVPESYSSDIQQTIISKSKLIIGARYHSIVFAINNEVPFVALSYEHKISGLLEILGLKKHMFDIELLGSENVTSDKAVEEIEKIIDKAKSVPEARKKANEIAQKCMMSFVQQYM